MSDEAKLDRLLEELFLLKPLVQGTAESVGRIEKTVVDLQIGDAAQDERIANNGKDIDAMGHKLRRHINDHWRFVGIVVGLLAIAGATGKWLTGN